MLGGACRSRADGVDGAKQGIVAGVDIKLIWLVGIGRIVATDGYHLYCLAVVYAISGKFFRIDVVVELRLLKLVNLVLRIVVTFGDVAKVAT